MKVLNPDSLAQLEQHLDTHFALLGDILAKLSEEQFTATYKRNVGTVLLDGNGQGVVELDAAQGFNRTLERVSIIVTGVTAGNVAVFVDAVSPLTLIEFISNPVPVTIAPLGQVVAYSDAFNNSLRIPSTSKLLVQFSAFGAGAVASVNIQENLSPIAENHVQLHRFHGGSA